MNVIDTRRVGGIAIGLAAYAAAAAAPGARQDAPEPADEVLDAIVAVSGTFSNGPTSGAGIVFGGDSKRILVLTAGHVVRRRSGETARDLQVRFRSRRGSPVPARFADRADPERDIAVLEVPDAERHGVSLCSQSFGWLGDFSAVQRGDAVYPIGHPTGLEWVVPATMDKVAQVSGDTIVFQSLLIGQGHSGGALVDGRGDIVGLIQAHEPPFGRALAIGPALDVAAKWGYLVAAHWPYQAHRALDPPVHLDDLGELLAAGGCAITREYDEFGLTPLHVAAMRGDAAGVALLLRHGADVHQRRRRRGTDTALALAAQHPEMLTLLLKAGARVDEADGSGNTPLLEASRLKVPESVRRLLAAGADVNHANAYGETALFLAVRRADVASVRLLLAAGADVNVRTRGGDSPLSLVADSDVPEKREIYAMLRQKGALQ